MKEFIKKLHFFTHFDEQEMKEILKDAAEKPFQKDEFLIREGQSADHVFVITRGVATESCKETGKGFKEKKSVGSIVSFHHLMSGVTRYQTSCVADTVVYAVKIPIESLKPFIKKRKIVEEHVFRECFYFLVKFNPEELKVFDTLDKQTLLQILNNLSFKRYKAGTIIDVSTGAIFLKGQAEDFKEDEEENGKSYNYNPK
mmetsp:Transcript_38779/g.34473  ORF Transcript_38779/g.34473 Transcript_38779/m.34473 type:complete len:200 (+) Transcript_38779:2539-3138(+)